MSRLTPINGLDVVKALQKVGFVVMRQRGSHVFLKHWDGRATVVSVHRGEELGPGILLKIAHDVKISRKELLELLGK